MTSRLQNPGRSTVARKSWVAQGRQALLRGVFATAASLILAPLAQAQTAANANAAYDGWLKAFLVKDSGKTYFVDSLSKRDMAFMWGQAYIITGVEDAYDVDQLPERRQLIIDLLDTFEAQNHADLSWDSWNDDTAWAVIALIRGYRISGRKSFLDAAVQAWNMSYARGWDDTYGGGIWENMDNVPDGGKCGLSNWPFVFSGIQIYQATGDASFLTRSEQIYAFSRAHLFDATTGVVHEQIGPKGVSGDDNAYNSGLIVNAANALFKATGNVQYYNDALVVANHVIGKYPIMTEDHPANGDFGGDQFFRGLGNFARENKLWSTYSKWFKANAAAAWSNRRTDYDVSLNNFTKTTPQDTTLGTMEAEGSVVVQQAIQSSAMGKKLKGKYQIHNAGSGMAVTVAGDSKADSAAIVQSPFTGQKGALWKFVSAGGGFYYIQNVNSGLDINVSGASGKSGALLVQWPGQGLTPGNDHWRAVRNADATYTFINMYSGLALDVTGASTTADTQLEQWFSNSTAAQKFKLIAAGTTEGGEGDDAE